MNKQYDGNNVNDKTYQITTDFIPRNTKPISKNEIGIISNNLTHKTGLTINQFSSIVSQPNGYSWSGSLYDGKRSNSTWLSQSVFALDFDKGILSVDKVYKRFSQFEITPQLWYSTFSNTDDLKKFRVVLFLDKQIEDFKLQQFIVLSLLRLFPESDQSCKDAGRFYFGGQRSVVIHTNPISTNQFIDALSINMMTSDSNSLRKIPMGSSYFTQLNSAEKTELLYRIDKSCDISATDKSILTTSYRRGQKQRIDIDVARQKVRILDEFLNGYWLTHNQLFGLATNLLQVEGGAKLMKETMKKFNSEGKTNYTDNNFNILPYVNRVDYHPEPIYKFSTFTEDEGLLDIVSETKETRGLIEIVEPVTKMELEEAEKQMKKKFEEVINHGETGKIYLFSLPTAIGKTESLIRTKATIAVPTNQLKNEIGDRMLIDYKKTPDRAIFENEEINRQLDYYYRIGLPKKSMQILNSLILTSNSSKYSKNDIITAKQYIEDLKTSVNSTDTVITTHKRSLFTPFPHDTLIFDEDPLNSLLEIKELKISDVFKLNLMANQKELRHIIDFLTNSTPLEFKQTPTFNIDIDKLIESLSQVSIESNIIDFLSSSFFVKKSFDPDKVIYIIKRELPKDKKIIIMSASPSLYIYEKLYGERLEVIDIRNVQQMGKVIQHTKRSCSREGLDNYFQVISEQVGDKPVLTFKSYGKRFKNPLNDMYFGNCSGYDRMKGKDMAVVGTPHRNTYEYYLTAKVLGIDFKSTDMSMSFQKIDHNGFRFKFNCFEHPELREIQLSFIESDLIQAVGRARTLRTTANVDLFSNFPLRISDQFVY